MSFQQPTGLHGTAIVQGLILTDGHLHYNGFESSPGTQCTHYTTINATRDTHHQSADFGTAGIRPDPLDNMTDSIFCVHA
jgi:hypothetical protein